MKITKFFSNIKEEINVNKRFREQYSSLLSPDFYALDLFKIDENQVSDVIAFFLDPNETHGQGDKFLKIFLEKISSDKLDLLSYLSEVTNISVIREESTSKNRRIDIVVHFKTGSIEKLIGVENKIHKNTPDQENQMSDYLKHLKNNVSDSKDFCLLYLAPKGKKISEISIHPDELNKAKENNTIKCINYSDLIIPIFKEFQLVCESERLRYFLKEVELYFNKEFKGELYMNDTKKIKEIIKGDFETAFEINKNIEVVKYDLQKQLFENIEAYLNIKNYVVKDLYKSFDRFSFQLSKWKGHRVSYEFANNSFTYGVYKIKDEIQVETGNIYNLEELFKEADWKSSGNWIKYKSLTIDNYEFWNKMKNGEIYNDVEEFLNIILDEFNTKALVRKANV